jgi:predicted kinase
MSGNPRFTMTHGLPGSGKSTQAEQMVASDPENTVRVNRDDIRTALFGSEYHNQSPRKKCEEQVTAVQDELIRQGLAAGKHVISDDTNLNRNVVEHLHNLASIYNAEIEQLYFDVPVDVCKQRNIVRGQQGGRCVPEHVIDAMAQKAYDDKGHLKEYIVSKTSGKVSVVPFHTDGMDRIAKFDEEMSQRYPMIGNAIMLVDLDGTLAHNQKDMNEAFGVPGQKKNFHKFHKAAEYAPVNTQVLNLIREMRAEGINIVALSGRTDNYAQETINFLERVDAPVSKLLLKRLNDYRTDTEYKLEQLKKLRAEGFAVVGAIDDRPRVIQMFQREGLLVSTVEHTEPQDPSTVSSYPEPAVTTVWNSGCCIRCGQPLKHGNIGPVCRTKI